MNSRQWPAMADSVKSQLSPEANGRDIPFFPTAAFGAYKQSPLPARTGRLRISSIALSQCTVTTRQTKWCLYSVSVRVPISIAMVEETRAWA